jgi:hypothetical protein
VPYDSFNLAPRYAIFITAICFISFGKVLEVLAENKFYIATLRTSAVVSSMLAVFLFSLVKFPAYNIIKPINDLRDYYHNGGQVLQPGLLGAARDVSGT